MSEDSKVTEVVVGAEDPYVGEDQPNDIPTINLELKMLPVEAEAHELLSMFSLDEYGSYEQIMEMFERCGEIYGNEVPDLFGAGEWPDGSTGYAAFKGPKAWSAKMEELRILRGPPRIDCPHCGKTLNLEVAVKKT